MDAAVVGEARAILDAIGFPLEELPAAYRGRAPKVLAALSGVYRKGHWKSARYWGGASPILRGSRELIEDLNRHFGEKISRGSYDEIRRKCVRFLVEAGIVAKNPDDPKRATNSPGVKYAISETAGVLIREYGTAKFDRAVQDFLANHESLRKRFRAERLMTMVNVKLPDGAVVALSPGEHNELQKQIIEHLLPRWLKEPELIYVGDADDKDAFKNGPLMRELNVFDLNHDQLPDVIAYDRARRWLFIVEAVSSFGPLSPIRVIELKKLLDRCPASAVFVTAFPNKSVFRKFAAEIAWETEVWIASDPTHLIHFDGERFLGPFSN